MVKIWLTGKNGKGFFTLIDEEDISEVTEYPWHLHKTGYAVANIDGVITPLHKFLVKTPKGMYTDHINRNTLDNRRSNLRVCTFAENLVNTPPRNGKKYKGVYEEKHKKYKRFHAHATVDGRRISFGRYLTAKEAAIAYDKNIVKLRGKFAYLNFPVDTA